MRVKYPMYSWSLWTPYRCLHHFAIRGVLCRHRVDERRFPERNERMGESYWVIAPYTRKFEKCTRSQEIWWMTLLEGCWWATIRRTAFTRAQSAILQGRDFNSSVERALKNPYLSHLVYVDRVYLVLKWWRRLYTNVASSGSKNTSSILTVIISTISDCSKLRLT